MNHVVSFTGLFNVGAIAASVSLGWNVVRCVVKRVSCNY